MSLANYLTFSTLIKGSFRGAFFIAGQKIMPRPDINITAAHGFANSIFPSGPPAPIGALSYRGNPVHNGEITIISDGSIDFGVKSGFLIQALMLDSSVGGTDLEITSSTIEAGQQVLSTAYTNTDGTRIKLHSVAGLPYGVGIAMGDQDLTESSPRFGKIRTISRAPYKSVFKFEFGIYPTANQTACIANSPPGGQIKGSWDYFSPDGTSSADDTDVYTGVFAPGPVFGEPALSASNFGFIGSVIYPVDGSYTPIRVDTTHYRTTMTARESTLTFSKTNGSVHMRVADYSDGTLCSYHVNVNIEPTILNVSCDTHDFPANVQSIFIHKNMQYYLSERVILGNSPARVEICDTQYPQTDRLAVTKTRRFGVCLPRAWSRRAIRVKVREQMFAGESLIGKYFHIYKDATLANPNGVFVGSILNVGEVL